MAETIESALRQTYPRVEVIVVDDGSTDRSWEVIRSFGDRITPERLPRNGGASAARNRGFTLSSGAFVMFLDADDVLAPDAVAALVAAVRDRPGAIAFCEWRRLACVDALWVQRPAEVPLPAAGADHLRGWIEELSWIPPCAVLWRRDDFERSAGWDESLSLNDDGDLMMGALASRMRLVQAEGGTAYYRYHGSARLTLSTQIFSREKLQSQQRVFDKLAARLELWGRLREYADSLALAYHRVALLAYTQGFHELGRACENRAERLGGRRAVSRTVVGRVLTTILGMGRKEQLAQWLARRGVMTRTRRIAIQRARKVASTVANR
ncbi:MAG: glycosyltransferase [Gemmatimonadetes bacterium]|nr:glycosyltransferase [Gemmatimonadota bacterium]